MPEARKLVTISIPVLNEAENIGALHTRLDLLAREEPGYDFEFLFTDNASTDGTFGKLAEIANFDPRVRVLKFSRNFGFQKSILCNYQNARGACAVQIDADLQDPPELIHEFLRKWEQGYKVVYGIRRSRQESAVLNGARRTYYALVDWLSEVPVPRNAGDFRLIDRLILDHLANVNEQTPYLRGLIAGLGYAQTGIEYDRDKRTAGKSKFRFFHLLELAIDGITSQSVRPLRLMTMFGLAVSLVSLVTGLYYAAGSLFFFQDLPSGFTTIVIFLLLLIGINSFFLGLLGEYIGRIFNNTRGRPVAIVESRIEPLPDNKDDSAS